MSLQVFVIFHDGLDKRNYELLDKDEFDLLTFVAVNENIQPKNFDSEFFKNVMNEWELPVYDPKLQMRYICDETMEPKSPFNETGVHWHLAHNNVCTSEYIYVCHNDMIFTKGSLRNIQNQLKPGLGLTIARVNFETLVNTSTYGESDIGMYIHTLQELRVPNTKYYPMFTNCAMETKVFEEQMEKLIKINKFLFIHTLAGKPYRPAITFERTWALAMGGVLDEIRTVNGILHKHPPIDDILKSTQWGSLTQYPEYQ